MVAEETVRAANQESNLREQRMVEVRLAKPPAWDRPITLSWSQGIVGKTVGSKTRRVLKPGDKTILDISRAQAYFGMFTLLHDLEDVMDEKRRASMLAQFEDFKARALLQWGEFPRPHNHMKDGNEPLGPCRFPDVYVTVIEANGERWQEMRLRDLYGWGDWYDAEPKRRAFEKPAAGPDMASELARLREEAAEQRGLIMGLLGAQQGAAAKTGGK